MARLPGYVRTLIYRWHIVHGYNPRRIHELLIGETPFAINDLQVSLLYLIQICRRLHDRDFAEWYLLGSIFKHGRKPSLNEDEKEYLLHIVRSSKTIHLNQLRQKFVNSYRGSNDNIPSISTIFRILKKAKFSLKKTTRRHVRFNEAEALDFFRRISHIPPHDFVFIDEASCSPESFRMRYGRAPLGEECLINQIVIGNRCFSLTIAVTMLGIASWQLVEGTNSELEFQQFLNSLRTRLFPENVLILDNAAIHRTEQTQILLEAVSNGKFYYGPRYAPHLMPHERVLSLIKREVREREVQATMFPVETISEVVGLFSIGGSRSSSLFNFWNQYVTNNNHFVNI